MKNIAIALVKAQSEMSNAVKGNINPFLKNKYADLNAIRDAVIPTLNAHGIAVLQPMVTENGKNYIRTTLLHESGETITSDTEIVQSKQNDAQSQGSGITYARRYGLQSLVCIGAEDDDGNKASSPKQPQKPIATIENLKTAKSKGFTIQQVADVYFIPQEIGSQWNQI